MGGSIRFSFADSFASRVKVIESVPNSWRWIDGILRYPEELIPADQIAKHTGFYFSQFNSHQPHVIAATVKGSPNVQHIPDMQIIGPDRKLPEFITFETAGYSSKEDFELVRKFACGYVRMGYTGWLNFYMADYKRHHHDNPARCDFRFISRRAVGTSEVVLKWEEEFGGYAADLADIVAACHGENLFNPDLPRNAFT